MKCSNCGGELVFNDNIAICSSCGSNHKIESAFENTDVCICYTEYDENGKRTKDSIISAEIYKKLESKKINTFYERISAANAAGDDLELIRYSAISRAKIIIFVGISEECFSNLFNKYVDNLADKKIIPVISGMKPEQLPEELRRFQASNFDAVGALNDLSISILNFLGYDKEVELDEIYKKKAKKKKMLITILLSSLAAIVCIAAVLAIVFWPEKEEPVVLTDSDIYNGAILLLDEGKYLEAAAEFNKISGYKDSSKQLKKIYDRYDGYYLNEEENCSLYLNIVDGKTAEFTFEKIVDEKVVKTEESMIIKKNRFSGKYTDSFENEGNISVKLNNQTIVVKVTTNVENGDVSLGEVSVKFKVKDKSDRPTIKSLTKETLLDWINNPISLDDVKAAGFELEYINHSDDYDVFFGEHYKIVNTDFSIIVSNYDLTGFKGEYSEDSPTLDEFYIIAAMAPAKFISPEKIGADKCAYTENGVAYIPDVAVLRESSDYESDKYYLEFVQTDFQNTDFIIEQLEITEDIIVGFCSKTSVGAYIFNQMVKSNEEIYRRSVVHNYHYMNNPKADVSSYVTVTEVVEKNNKLLMRVTEMESNGGLVYTNLPYNDSYYKYDITTNKCEFITTFEDLPSYTKESYWENHPEFFGDFMDESALTTQKDSDSKAEKVPNDDNDVEEPTIIYNTTEYVVETTEVVTETEADENIPQETEEVITEEMLF